MQMNLSISKPFLWLYGGHPMLPSFEDHHEKLQQLLKLCNTIWPGTMRLWRHPSNGMLHLIIISFILLLPLQIKYISNLCQFILADDHDFIVVALSSIPNLKRLFMRG